jgi:hypothetical protein
MCTTLNPHMSNIGRPVSGSLGSPLPIAAMGLEFPCRSLRQQPLAESTSRRNIVVFRALPLNSRFGGTAGSRFADRSVSGVGNSCQ